MSIKIEALVKAELLIWGRESIGLDIDKVAKKIKILPELLKDWEIGNSRPTISQLRKIAKVYKRPIAVFFLSEKPKDFDTLKHDFRKLPDEVEVSYSPELNFLIRKVHQRQLLLLNLTKNQPTKITNLIGSETLETDIEKIAEKLRRLINISLQEQRNWRDKYEALNEWKVALEKIGVTIFQSSIVSSKEMRGFSISNKKVPLIVLNAKDDPHGRIFTLFHELSHLILNNAGLCDLKEYKNDNSLNQRTERYCNQLAATILVPSTALLSEQLLLNINYEKEWDNTELETLSKKFNVSREMMLRRLLTLGKTSNEYYQRKRKEFLEKYEEEKKKPKKPIPFPPSKKTIRDNGKPFIRKVISSYYDDSLTLSDVSEYLDIQIKHIPKIEREIAEKVSVERIN